MTSSSNTNLIADAKFKLFMDHQKKAKSFHLFAIQSLLHAVVGLITGAGIDKGFDTITQLVKTNYTDDESQGTRTLILFTLGITQLLVSVAVTWILTKLLPFDMYLHWQQSVSGMVFAAVFYGVQQNLYNNVRVIYTNF